MQLEISKIFSRGMAVRGAIDVAGKNPATILTMEVGESSDHRAARWRHVFARNVECLSASHVDALAGVGQHAHHRVPLPRLDLQFGRFLDAARRAWRKNEGFCKSDYRLPAVALTRTGWAGSWLASIRTAVPVSERLSALTALVSGLRMSDYVELVPRKR